MLWDEVRPRRRRRRRCRRRRDGARRRRQPADRLLPELAVRRRRSPARRRARHRRRATASTPASAARRRRCSCRTPARAILEGELDLAVITGAEALETVRQAEEGGRAAGVEPPRPEPAPPFPFEAPFHPAEVAHEVFQAWLTFPVFDIARRARLGVDPDDLPPAARRAAGADDRGRGDATRTPGSRRALSAERARHADARRTAWSATRTRSTWCRSWTSTWPPP